MSLRHSLSQIGQILQSHVRGQQLGAIAGAARYMASSTVNGVPVEVCGADL